MTAPVTARPPDRSRHTAALCPCGCGRKLSPLERGLAKQARSVGERIKFLEQYTLPLNLDPRHELALALKEDLEGFIEQGREINDHLLAAIHGVVPADAFEHAAMHRWLQAAHAMELTTKTVLSKTQEPG